MRNAKIAALGAYVPPMKLTNQDLEKMVDTSDEWIMERTGIRERRIAGKNIASSDMAIEAAWSCLRCAEVQPEEIELIIVATATPDHLLPATACLVQQAIGAINAAAFDMEVGCTGFVYALVTASQFVAAGSYDNVLVIGAETLSRFVDWSDRSTCCLFGDGAGAALVTPAEEGDGIIGFILGSEGKGADLLQIPGGGSKLPSSPNSLSNKEQFIHMDGRAVFRFAVKIMESAVNEVLDKVGMTVEDLDVLVPHQANLRIIESASARLGVPLEKFYMNIERYGNTSSASVPIALWEAVSQGRIRKGNVVALVAFGAGLTWGSVIIRW